MSPDARRSWLGVALLVGAAYFLVGRAFAAPATHVHAWRLAAWLVSAAIFAAHVGYEHLRLGSVPRRLALHTALAAAMGALALAVAGAIHSLGAGSGLRPAWLLAFVAWPLVTGVPAFLVALGAAMALPRGNRRPAGT